MINNKEAMDAMKELNAIARKQKERDDAWTVIAILVVTVGGIGLGVLAAFGVIL